MNDKLLNLGEYVLVTRKTFFYSCVDCICVDFLSIALMFIV